MKKSTATDVNKYQKLNSIIYMIDSDQRPDSNRRPLLKSTPTDVIISNHGPIEWYSHIGVFSKFSDLWQIYWLGLGLG